MSKQCPGCRGTNPGPIAATIFANNGSTITLNLCHGHDLELFKIGQLRFSLKYNISLGKDAVSELLSLEDKEVFADIA